MSEENGAITWAAAPPPAQTLDDLLRLVTELTEPLWWEFGPYRINLMEYDAFGTRESGVVWLMKKSRPDGQYRCLEPLGSIIIDCVNKRVMVYDPKDAARGPFEYGPDLANAVNHYRIFPRRRDEEWPRSVIK